MKIVKPSVTLEWITPNALQAIERAGRTCYKSEDKITEDSAEKFCVMIHQRGHESVVEHAAASFRIVCDRGVSHEIVRHRLASYSQESTRYCNYGKGKFGGEITVIKPFDIPDRCERWERECPCFCRMCNLFSIWYDTVATAEIGYLGLLKEGVSPQIARSVLPNCLKTEIVMTANFREWLHFLKLRTSPAAHPQMREIAFMIEDILNRECPAIFKKEATTNG